MAVHSFPSLEEIRAAANEEERADVIKKNTAESRTLDNAIRDAIAIEEPKKRTEALLDLEKLYEFKRSHPTVEVLLCHADKKKLTDRCDSILHHF
jgi:4,5-DOPA dioxygenase extradiol